MKRRRKINMPEKNINFQCVTIVLGQWLGGWGFRKTKWCIHMYYCMTGRAIQGNIPFKIDRISPTEGRDDTEVENGIFPRIARPEDCNNRFIV